jgi:hypothetical protein
MECGGATAVERSWPSRSADTAPGAECERVRGTIRPIDQGGMSRSDDSDRRAALPAGDQGIRRSLSSRAQSSSAGQRAHRRRRSPADRTTNSPSPAARWTAQLLRPGRVIGPAELSNITGFNPCCSACRHIVLAAANTSSRHRRRRFQAPTRQGGTPRWRVCSLTPVASSQGLRDGTLVPATTPAAAR